MADTERKQKRGGPIWIGVKSALRTRVIAGLVLVIPIWITYILVQFVFGLLRDSSWWVVREWLLSPWGRSVLQNMEVTPEALRENGFAALPDGAWWMFTIFCIVLTVLLLYLLGVMTTNVFGVRLVATGESLLDRVPLVKTVYRASKQVLQTVAGDGSQTFQRVALVPYPSKEMMTVGFVTKTTRDSRTDEELFAVFVPTVPNPTTGFVFLVRRSDVVELDWTVEQAIQTIMSGGVLMPASVPLTGAAGLLKG